MPEIQPLLANGQGESQGPELTVDQPCGGFIRIVVAFFQHMLDLLIRSSSCFLDSCDGVLDLLGRSIPLAAVSSPPGSHACYFMYVCILCKII